VSISQAAQLKQRISALATEQSLRQRASFLIRALPLIAQSFNDATGLSLRSVVSSERDFDSCILLCIFRETESKRDHFFALVKMAVFDQRS